MNRSKQIKQVNARGLGFTFLYDLKMWDCHWIIHCVPSDASSGYFWFKLHHDWRQDLAQRLANDWTPSDLSRQIFQDRIKSSPSPPAPGKIWCIPNPKSEDDKWNSYTNSVKSTKEHPSAIPHTKYSGVRGSAPATPPAASGTQPSTSSRHLSGDDWQALAAEVLAYSAQNPKQPPAQAPSAPIATQPQAPLTPKPVLQTEPDVFSILDVGPGHAAYDEPPTMDEFNYAIRAPKPQLLGNGSFPMPTFHTLHGIPRATFVTLRAILKAGFWAVTIFIACGILYFGVGAPLIAIILRDRGKKDWEALPLAVIGLLLISPIAIPNLVGGIQWAAALLGTAVSWMVGLLAIVTTWSAAIGVLVGIPHIWKSRVRSRKPCT